MTESIQHSINQQKRTNVILALRRRGHFWSVEELFENVRKYLPDGIVCKTITAPRDRVSLKSVAFNLLWMRNLDREAVVHQTGDIHYAILSTWRRPTVLTILDLRFFEEARGVRRLVFWLWWIYLPCLRADCITVISEFTKARLLTYCKCGKKTLVIPCCVGPEFVVTPKIWPASKPRLLHIGTTPNKNLLRIIEACHGLPVQLVILGQLSKEQIGFMERCHVAYENMTGLTKNEVVALYASCDAVLFVSTYEGFGLPILEAQAVGRPLITSNISPMREIADAAAILVDPFSTVAIRAGIERLIKEPHTRAKLVANGLENVKLYSAPAVAQQYASIYDELSDYNVNYTIV